MRKRLVAYVLALAASGPVISSAEPHPACAEPQRIDYGVSAASLRDIAASCEASPTARLFYNRAHYKELLERYRATLRLQTYGRDDDGKNFHAYRIFMGLTEALAQQRIAEAPAPTTDWLNGVYDQVSEIAWLRLRGYDLQADRLERLFWKN